MSIENSAELGDRAKLIHLIIMVIGFIGAVGGVVDFLTDPGTVARVLAVLTILVGLGCVLVARRVKARVSAPTEVLAVAAALAVLAVVETVVSGSWAKLFGLVPPAALVLLVTRMTREGERL